MNQFKFPFALMYVATVAGYFVLVRLFDVFNSHQGVAYDVCVAMFFAAHFTIGSCYLEILLRRLLTEVYQTRRDSIR